jgi:hypothetical protein
VLSDATLAYGEKMVVALLGVDDLIKNGAGEEDDRLVVLNMAPDHVPLHFGDIDEAISHFEELRRQSGALPEVDRRVYYDQLCGSTIALMRWRQGLLPFKEQIAQFLHVPPAPASDTELDTLRNALRTRLTAMGFTGDLREQCSAWQERNAVPQDEVAGVLQALMDEAWDRTVQRMNIPAPKSDAMRVTVVTGASFGARCDYLKRTVELNARPNVTRQSLKHLAVHECYPGHYVQFKLRETWYKDGLAPADGLLSIVNSASSSPFEGIASNGLYVLDWVESDDDYVAELMRKYGSALATGGAWQMHALGRPDEEVHAWLSERALLGNEDGAVQRTRFFAAPQRAALIWSYWWGDRAVEPVWRRQPPERRDDLLRYLYGRMHSVRTVGMFDEA